MWNYRCNDILFKVLWPLKYLYEFLTDLSWSYAHYKNGRFMTMRKGTPDQNSVLITAGFWQRVKWAHSAALRGEE
jgi:hypothetical protein